MEKKKEYLRCLMLFYFRKNKTATDTKRKICAVYGEDAVSERVVQIWFSKFRKGDTSCVDGQRTGRPGVADSDKVKMLIERNPHFKRLGYVLDGEGWRFDDSAPKCNDNDNHTPHLDKEKSAAKAEVFGYCNKEFAYEEESLNCGVQITPTEANICAPRPPTDTFIDFAYVGNDSYHGINEKGKENDNTGNTAPNVLPSFSEYFSNVYTSYIRGGSGYCAIENRNINSVEAFNGGYPLKGYE